MSQHRQLYQCNRRNKWTLPTTGTIFHATRLPLTAWFAAVHLIVTVSDGPAGFIVATCRRVSSETPQPGGFAAGRLRCWARRPAVPVAR